MATITRAASQVRPFELDDIPQVASLHQRMFSDRTGPASRNKQDYIREVFFNNPWRDDDFHPYVHESRGRIDGFLGQMPRRMTLDGRPIRVSAPTQFMVAPENGSAFTAIALMEAVINGPHDLAYADNANEFTRSIWERLGGKTVYLYSLYWTRKFADALPGSPRAVVSGSELKVETIREDLPWMTHRDRLVPDYDVTYLDWVLRLAGTKTRHGQLKKVVVSNDRYEVAGWYIYYSNPGGVSRVVQLASRDAAIKDVLGHMFRAAHNDGSTAMTGRIIPRHMQALTEAGCKIHRGLDNTGWCLVHAREESNLVPILTGESFLSRFEGEGWLNILGADDVVLEGVLR